MTGQAIRGDPVLAGRRSDPPVPAPAAGPQVTYWF
jgi:hypothetical protein